MFLVSAAARRAAVHQQPGLPSPPLMPPARLLS